ncbi:TBC1 domain family member 9 [Bienertia sinuspersici]
MMATEQRDSYGFAVRPQHLHRYREYGNIYKEEEDERSEKWRNFLEQFSESAMPGAPIVEHSSEAKAAIENTDAVQGKIGGHVCSDQEPASDGGKEGGTQETERREIKDWGQIRPSLDPIEKMMSVRVKSRLCTANDYVHPMHNHLPLIDEELPKKRTSVNNLEKWVPNSETVSEERDEDLENLEDSVNSHCTLNNLRELREFSDISGQKRDMHVATLSSCSPEKEKTFDTIDDKQEDSDFENMVTAKPLPWKEELVSLVHGGVPKSLRGEVWQAFVGVQARRVERYYQKLLSVDMDVGDGKNLSGDSARNSTACTSEKWKKQIEKDLPRTFPGHPALDGEGRDSLRRILTAYARHNPSVGYCQAMNFFAGLLLLLMPEENAFWTLVGLIDDYFDGYYTHEMIESQVDQLVFDELMRERFPKLVNHLDYLGVEVAWISGTWFLSIFVNILPWESVLRVWDVLLFEGNRVMLFRTALALMELYGPALVTTKDAGDAFTLLQSLTGSTFDSSQLVFTACMGFLTVTEGRLEELRNKHRPSVLGIIEERAKGSPVSKDSKSLQSKLYSFKHDAQSLIKEPNTNEGFDEKLINSIGSEVNSSPDNFDEFICGLNIDSEVDSLPEIQDQVVWLKVELCRLMEEKRLATLRNEELETAFLEMVQQDNRRELSARVERLEQEVILLQQALTDKQEQERAMVEVLMRVEQEQKVTEDARIAAEQDVAAQKYEVHVLQ